MSFRWSELGSSPATPESKKHSNPFGISVDAPSTTPAAAPPSDSIISLTPAGEPSPSFLQSSIGAMSTIGATSNKPKAPNFGKPNLRNSKSSYKGSNDPLGRSIRGSTRGPSGLSREYHGEDDENDRAGSKKAGGGKGGVSRSGTFGMNFDDNEVDEDAFDNDDAPEDEQDAERDDYEEEEEEEYQEDDGGEEEDDEDAEAMMDDDADYEDEDDLLQEIAEAGVSRGSPNDDGSDHILLATPAADRRIMREADAIFRASTMRSVAGRKVTLKYTMLAKGLYSHQSFATVSEPDLVLIQTEDIMNRLYDEGVGSEDDEEKLDRTLSRVSVELVSDVWTPHAESLPTDDSEQSAKVGPGARAPPFAKALYIANLLLRIHHTPPIPDDFGGWRFPCLPEILFKWQEDEHNLHGSQADVILQHRPSPASHALFWPAVFSTLVRGNIVGTVRLLKNAAWEYVRGRPGGVPTYAGQALANIRRAVEELCEVMEGCPAVTNQSWDIRSSDWTLFRLKAKAALEALINFAEGKDRPVAATKRFNDNIFNQSSGTSLSGLARKAQSQIPWDVYENLQSLYAILTGESGAILAAAQDWCEATIGLFGWWDDGHKRSRGSPNSRLANSIYAVVDDEEELLDRLVLSLHKATGSDFHFNSEDGVEVGVASIFEGNVEGVIGFLRLWSLPIATSVAEIAALGRWLPLLDPPSLINMGEFDMEDLEVLGVKPSSGPDDKDGIKDSTLIQYARSLADRKEIAGTTSRGKYCRDGWEMAVQVVGRMDAHERSEQMVQELLQGVLSTINQESRATVDKLWRLLTDLGMVNFAEDAAENFGDILAKDTFRFGEALWYYALAHNPNKLRDVLNTLMSVSLVESTVYPPDNDIDETLRGLLKERTTTLEAFAKQDLEAAELLGKMLSGYATLRKFYEYRDSGVKTGQKTNMQRRQAAAAMTAVIASADDNIRGGLYDDSRDAVVSEDFLLALLGEFSVFVGQSPPVITLEQIDTLLKAIEDIQTVGSRVYNAADEFFKLVLASGQGKGSTPASLLDQSDGSLGGSFVMTNSSMIASQLHKSVSASGMLKGGVKRGWDWRSTVFAASGSADVLKKLRLGLTKDLADLWLEQADNVIM